MSRLVGDTSIPFMSLTRVAIPISLLVILGGVSLFTVLPTRDKLGIDFTGGFSLSVRTEEPQSIQTMRDEIAAIPGAVGEAEVKPILDSGTPEAGYTAFRITGKILLLYGSLRKRAFSRLMTEEAARVLQRLGAETRTFDPSGLPLPDDAEANHPKVEELRDLVTWSEGMVWCSPERHGAMTGIMKAQIDWIPLSIGAVRPTQGKTLAVMQVCGGSQSFNAINQLRFWGAGCAA